MDKIMKARTAAHYTSCNLETIVQDGKNVYARIDLANGKDFTLYGLKIKLGEQCFKVTQEQISKETVEGIEVTEDYAYIKTRNAAGNTSSINVQNIGRVLFFSLKDAKKFIKTKSGGKTHGTID